MSTPSGAVRPRPQRGRVPIPDRALLRIDRAGMGSGRDRPYFSGEHERHGVDVQVLADPAGPLIWA